MNEWSKLIYGFINKETKITTYAKLCVPVDRKKNAWLDDRCPLDQCTEFGINIILFIDI